MSQSEKEKIGKRFPSGHLAWTQRRTAPGISVSVYLPAASTPLCCVVTPGKE